MLEIGNDGNVAASDKSLLVPDRETSKERAVEHLANLSRGIMDRHHAANKHGAAALLARREAGAMLRQAKACLPHGFFNKWCEAQIDISHTTRALYMKLDEAWPIYESSLNRVPEAARGEYYYSLEFAKRAISGDFMWDLLVSRERENIRSMLSSDELSSFTIAASSWSEIGSLQAIDMVLEVATKNGWFIRDLLEECGIRLKDSAQFAIEAMTILDVKEAERQRREAEAVAKDLAPTGKAKTPRRTSGSRKGHAPKSLPRGTSIKKKAS